jgi:hypothetical protein
MFVGPDRTILFYVGKSAHACERGTISAQEFATSLADHFAGDARMQTEEAEKLIALIPALAIGLVKRQIEVALSPGYMRVAFAMGGYKRSKEEERAAAMLETTREQAWAAILKPLLMADK